jgi:hypothetical protein
MPIKEHTINRALANCTSQLRAERRPRFPNHWRPESSDAILINRLTNVLRGRDLSFPDTTDHTASQPVIERNSMLPETRAPGHRTGVTFFIGGWSYIGQGRMSWRTGLLAENPTREEAYANRDVYDTANSEYNQEKNLTEILRIALARLRDGRGPDSAI